MSGRQCPHCGDILKTRQGFNTHVKKHNLLNQCHVCLVPLITPNQRRYHEQLHHHQSSGENYVCNVCDKKFKTQRGLREHKEREEKKYKHRCSECDKVFEKRRELKDHMSVHTGEFNHNCDICGKAFRHKSNMYRHRKIHITEQE